MGALNCVFQKWSLQDYPIIYFLDIIEIWGDTIACYCMTCSFLPKRLFYLMHLM